MTITDAHADFLSDAYAGMSAALYSSAGSLREYWEHSFQARDGLTGSILKLKDGSWAIIPPDDRSVKQISGAWKALCKPSSGAAGRNILVKDIGNTVSHILPAVLSSHLKSDNRGFHEGIYAKHVRGRHGLRGQRSTRRAPSWCSKRRQMAAPATRSHAMTQTSS